MLRLTWKPWRDMSVLLARTRTYPRHKHSHRDPETQRTSYFRNRWTLPPKPSIPPITQRPAPQQRHQGPSAQVPKTPPTSSPPIVSKSLLLSPIRSLSTTIQVYMYIYISRNPCSYQSPQQLLSPVSQQTLRIPPMYVHPPSFSANKLT